MADTGVKTPTAATTQNTSPYVNNEWTTPQNIYGAGTANVTGATYDADDYTFILKAQGFDFSAIPDGSTIDGVQVVINGYYATSVVSIALASLLDASGATQGSNLYATPQALTTGAANYTVGGSTNKWGLDAATLTAALVKNSNFGVGIACLAGPPGGGNTNNDVYIDSITMQVWYTAPAGPEDTPLTPIAGEIGAASVGGVLGLALLAAVGAANVTGYAPTLNIGVTPNRGEVTYGATSYSVIPHKGNNVNFEGYAPTFVIEANQRITPVAGSVTLTGYQPGQAITLRTTTGGLEIAGYGPTVIQKSEVTPSSVSLGVATAAPSLDSGLHPLVSSLAVTGGLPKSAIGVAPNKGSIDITGNEPSLFIRQSLTPDAVGVDITGYEPALFKLEYRTPSASSVDTTGYSPQVIVPGDTGRTPVSGAVDIQLIAPTLFTQEYLVPSAGSIGITGYSPSLFRQDSRLVSSSAVEITGSQPTLSKLEYRTPVVASVDVTGYNPILEIPGETQRIPSAGGLVITGHAPSLLVLETVAPSVGSVDITGYNAIRQISGESENTDITPVMGVVRIGAFVHNTEITPSASSVDLLSEQPKQSLVVRVSASELRFGQVFGSQITPFTVHLGVTGYVSKFGHGIIPGTQPLSVTSETAVLSAPIIRAPLTGVLSVDGRPAGIAAPDVEIVPGTGYVRFGESVPDTVRSTQSGALDIVSETPIVDNSGLITYTPPTGSASITGYAPALDIAGWGSWSDTGEFTSSSDIELTPNVGSLAVASAETTIDTVKEATPGTGVIGVTGYTPVFRVPNTITPVKGELLVSGNSVVTDAPRLIQPVLGPLVTTGYAPTVTDRLNTPRLPLMGSLVVTGRVSSLPGPASPVLYPNSGSLSVSVLAPALFQVDINVVSADQLVVTGYAPSVDGPKIITVSSGALVISGNSIVIDASRFITPLSGSVEVLGVVSEKSVPALHMPGTSQLVIAGGVGEFLRTTVITPSADAVGITGFAGSYHTSFVRSVGFSSLLIEGYAPTVERTFYWGRIPPGPAYGWHKKHVASDGWTRISKVTDGWTKKEG